MTEKDIENMLAELIDSDLAPEVSKTKRLANAGGIQYMIAKTTVLPALLYDVKNGLILRTKDGHEFTVTIFKTK